MSLCRLENIHSDLHKRDNFQEKNKIFVDFLLTSFYSSGILVSVMGA